MDDFSYDKVSPISGLSRPKIRTSQLLDSLDGVNQSSFKTQLIANIEIERRILDVKKMVLKTFKTFLNRFMKEASCFSHPSEKINDLKATIRTIRDKILSLKESIESSQGLIFTLMQKVEATQ